MSERHHQDGEIRAVQPHLSAGHGPPEVVLAATFALDPVTPFLREALLQTQLPHQVRTAPYGQLVEQFLSPQSPFASNVGGVNIALVRLSDWASVLPTEDDRDSITMFASAVRDFVRLGPAPTLVVICPEAPGRELPHLTELLISELRDLPGIATEFADRWIEAQDCADPHDAHAAAIAHLPYTDDAFAAIAIGITRVVSSLTVRPRKVVAVDCDHTLWGGACGDLPPSELDLGERFLAVQRFLKSRQEAGFLLALCSRNDPESVERVFAERGHEMALDRQDFISAQVSWQPKWTGIKALAGDLGLGVDSVVLVDDDPYVCAETGAALPEVAVVHVPPESDAAAVLAAAWELDRFFPTAEDRLRNATYRADADRAAMAASASPAELDERLRTRIEVRPATPADTSRIVQLLARTNQFTSATVDSARVGALLADGSAAWVAALSDRFGDYGTIAAAIAKTTDATTDNTADSTTQTASATDVECFAMSCRVLERGVAEALFGAVLDSSPYDALRVRLRPTGRNEVARSFLRRLADEQGTGDELAYEVTAAGLAAAREARTAATSAFRQEETR